jgi:hypothetical protein
MAPGPILDDVPGGLQRGVRHSAQAAAERFVGYPVG